MLDTFQRHPTNLDIMLQLIEIHKLIYSGLYMQIFTQQLKQFQKNPTIGMKLAGVTFIINNIPLSKGVNGKAIISFLKKYSYT